MPGPAFTRADYEHAIAYASTRTASLRIAGEPQQSALAELIAQTRERNAKLCDEVVRNRRDYSVEQRALAKKLAEEMRGGAR